MLETEKYHRLVPELKTWAEQTTYQYEAMLPEEAVIFHCKGMKFHMRGGSYSKEDWQRKMKEVAWSMDWKMADYTHFAPTFFDQTFAKRLSVFYEHFHEKIERIMRDFNVNPEVIARLTTGEHQAWKNYESRMGLTKGSKGLAGLHHINVWEMFVEPNRYPTNAYQYLTHLEFFWENKDNMENIPAKQKPGWVFCLYSHGGRFVGCNKRKPVSGGQDTEWGPDIGWSLF